jgi:intracellular sulfur oxidation DsrE/DsrF family protein
MSDDGVRVTVCHGLITGTLMTPLSLLATAEVVPPGVNR